MKNFKATAPGRLCLFGEHQDYLNLPVISLAIPLYATIDVTPNEAVSDRVLVLQIPQLSRTIQYDLDDLPPRQTALTNDTDFALAAIHEAIETDGWEFQCGATCISTSTIVMQAGCSSSTAFTVAWILVLAKLAGRSDKILSDRMELARLAHRAEVTHFGAPGGTMDHLSIALGGSCMRIGPGQWEVKSLPTLQPDEHGIWILADSGETKNTFSHLKRCKGDRLKLLKRLRGSWDAPIAGIQLSAHESNLLKATLTNRDTEREAARIWMSAMDETNSAEKLGKLMLQHHEALRDGLGLSTPKLESMRKAAMDSGAWGYKLVGSGGGGCSVSWVPKAHADNVAQAILDSGAKSVWMISKPCSGSQIEDATKISDLP